jgi:hypothetical protein
MPPLRKIHTGRPAEISIGTQNQNFHSIASIKTIFDLLQDIIIY